MSGFAAAFRFELQRFMRLRAVMWVLLAPFLIVIIAQLVISITTIGKAIDRAGTDVEQVFNPADFPAYLAILATLGFFAGARLTIGGAGPSSRPFLSSRPTARVATYLASVFAFGLVLPAGIVLHISWIALILITQGAGAEVILSTFTVPFLGSTNAPLALVILFMGLANTVRLSLIPKARMRWLYITLTLVLVLELSLVAGLPLVGHGFEAAWQTPAAALLLGGGLLLLGVHQWTTGDLGD